MWRKLIISAGRLFAGVLPLPARWWARPGYFDARGVTPRPGQRVLLVSCNWVGDNFFAIQILPALQEKFPRVDFHAMTKRASRDLWESLIPPERVIVGDAVVSDRRRETFRMHDLTRLAAECRARQFDGVIDLTGNRYSALLTFLCRPAWSLGSEGDELGGLYSLRAFGRRPGRHEAEKPRRVVEPLLGGFEFPGRLNPAAPTCEFDAFRERLGIGSTARLAVFAPGGGWEEKRWPTASFAQLGQILERRGFTVAATGGPNQAAHCREAVADVPGAVNAAGLTVGESLALLQRADLVIANDTAEGHLAAAFGTPVVALFGPTNPLLCGPIGPRVTVIRAQCPDRPEGERLHCRDLPGAPCDRRCIATIQPQRVADDADLLIQQME